MCSKMALERLLSFTSTYLCEGGLLEQVHLKNEDRTQCASSAVTSEHLSLPMQTQPTDTQPTDLAIIQWGEIII